MSADAARMALRVALVTRAAMAPPTQRAALVEADLARYRRAAALRWPRRPADVIAASCDRPRDDVLTELARAAPASPPTHEPRMTLREIAAAVDAALAQDDTKQEGHADATA